MNARVADTVFCLICVGVVLGNAAFFRARAMDYAAGDTELLAEANRIIRAFVVWVSALCLAFAAGVALGWTVGPVGADKSHPPPATLFDTLYAVAFGVLLARAAWWVYFRGGADVLARHHAMFRFPSSRLGVMLLWAVMTGVFVYGLLVRLGYVRLQ